MSIGHSIRYELLLAANNDKANTAFIPRNKADLEEILLTVASENLRDGTPVDESTVKYAKVIHVVPFQHSVNGYKGNLVEDYITPYFMDSYRMVSLGATFSTRGGEWAPQFKVVSIEGYQSQDCDTYIVGPDTKILRAKGVVEETGHERDSHSQDGSARYSTVLYSALLSFQINSYLLLKWLILFLFLFLLLFLSFMITVTVI